MAEGRQKQSGSQGSVVDLEQANARLIADVDRLTKDNSNLIVKNKDVVEKSKSLSALLEKSGKKIIVLENTIKVLNEQLEKMSGEFKNVESDEELVEIVCVPQFEHVKVFPLKLSGIEYSPVKKRGFNHFLVPKSIACRMISGNEPGRKYFLVGPMDSLDVKVRVDRRSEKWISYPRHALGSKGGRPTWLPVEIENPDGVK